jgi:2-(1,2-epoxy-1,2-dihydrophenyl)acetyl-CoA isomerase
VTSAASGVLRCVLASEKAGNSLDRDALVGATAALQAIRDGDPDGSLRARAVLLASDGASFCTGGDVKGFHAAADRQAHVTELAETFHQFILAVMHAPVPVVAAVPGWAVGAGMSIVCACDLVVGGPGTRFRPGYPFIGLSPDGGMSWSLPRIIGPIRARDLLLSDGVLGGAEAARLGLVTRLVPDDQIAAEAQRAAERLAAGPAGALTRIKRLVWDAADRDLPGHLPHEARSIGECAASPDGIEGVNAFAEQRPPAY